MVPLFRLLIGLFIVQTVVYVLLSMQSRARHRNKLEAEWRASGRSGDMEGFVETGLDAYDVSLRRKLLLGVYIVPLVLIAVLVYVSNYM